MDNLMILGPLADEKKGIRENITDGYFEFYVAGYTKTCQGISVQSNHIYLYQRAIEYCRDHNLPMPVTSDGLPGPDEIMFPFGQNYGEWKVILESEPTNPFDPDALIVKAVNVPGERYFVLGYVPKSISRIVSHNLDRLKDGWIKRTRKIFKRTLYTTKVAFGWKHAPSTEDAIFFEHLVKMVEALD